MTIAAMLAFGAMVPAAASAASSPSCSTQWQISQPFLAYGDFNSYALLSGTSLDNFDSTGWQLSGGAKIVTSTAADGTVAQVLDLPSRGVAVSPVICVNTAYPTLRTMVADVAGVQGVGVNVQFYTGGRWSSSLAMGTDKNTTGLPGFAPSRALQTHVSTITTATPAQFTFTGGYSTSDPNQDYQVYRVGVDPKAWY